METLRHDDAVNGRTTRARAAGDRNILETTSGSDHHQINAATIPCHLFDSVPVLTEIARSLMRGRKFDLQSAGLPFATSKSCLPPVFVRSPIAHRLFLCERWQSQIVRTGQFYALSAAFCGASCTNNHADAGRNVRSRQRWNNQSVSVWSFRLLLWPGTAVDGGVRNASNRSFTTA